MNTLLSMPISMAYRYPCSVFETGLLSGLATEIIIGAPNIFLKYGTCLPIDSR